MADEEVYVIRVDHSEVDKANDSVDSLSDSMKKVPGKIKSAIIVEEKIKVDDSYSKKQIERQKRFERLKSRKTPTYVTKKKKGTNNTGYDLGVVGSPAYSDVEEKALWYSKNVASSDAARRRKNEPAAEKAKEAMVAKEQKELTRDWKASGDAIYKSIQQQRDIDKAAYSEIISTFKDKGKEIEDTIKAREKEQIRLNKIALKEYETMRKDDDKKHAKIAKRDKMEYTLMKKSYKQDQKTQRGLFGMLTGGTIPGGAPKVFMRPGQAPKAMLSNMDLGAAVKNLRAGEGGLGKALHGIFKGPQPTSAIADAPTSGGGMGTMGPSSEVTYMGGTPKGISHIATGSGQGVVAPGASGAASTTAPSTAVTSTGAVTGGTTAATSASGAGAAGASGTGVLASLGAALGIGTAATAGLLLAIVAVLASILAVMFLVFKTLQFVLTTLKNSQASNFMQDSIAGPIESAAALFLFGTLSFISAVADFLGLDPKAWIEAMISNIQVIFGFIGGIFTENIEYLKSAFDHFKAAFTEGFGEIFTGFKTWLSGFGAVLELFQTGVSTILEKFWGGIGQMINGLLNIPAQFAFMISDLAAAFTNTVIGGFQTLLLTFTSTILHFLVGIGILPQEWADKILEVFTIILDGVRGFLVFLASAPAKIVGFIYDGVGNIIEFLMRGAGKIVDSIITGIISGFGTVTKAIGDFIGDALPGFGGGSGGGIISSVTGGIGRNIISSVRG